MQIQKQNKITSNDQFMGSARSGKLKRLFSQTKDSENISKSGAHVLSEINLPMGSGCAPVESVPPDFAYISDP